MHVEKPKGLIIWDKVSSIWNDLTEIRSSESVSCIQHVSCILKFAAVSYQLVI